MKKSFSLILFHAFFFYTTVLRGQAIDPNFSPSFGGRQIIFDIQVLNDGRLMVAGFFNGVNDRSVNNIVRLWPDGKVDTSFNSELAEEWLMVFAIDTLTNGNYVLGSSYWDPSDSTQLHALDITDENGTIVRRMGINYPYNEGIGIGTISFLGLDSEDHIYAGESGDFDLIIPEYGRQLAKFDSEGNLLQDFLADHMYLDDGSMLYNDLMIQPDDRVLVSGPRLAYDGIRRSAVIRLEKNGERDASFKAGIPMDYNVLKSTLLHDGSILVSGNGPGDIFMYKLDPSGTIDYDFYFGRGVCPEDRLVTPSFLQEIEPNRILVYGTCEEYTYSRNGTPFRILINERGQYMADFLPQLANAQITALTVREDGSMYIGGTFELENGIQTALIRTLPLPPLSVESVLREETLVQRLFPNPLNSDRLYVSYQQHLRGERANYQLIEPVTGRIVQYGTLTASPASTIRLAGLPSGVYLLKTKVDRAFEVLRVVRQ